MGNEELHNNEQHEAISDLIGTLKRVEAPANFDFGVKARIAAGKTKVRSGFRIPVFVGYAIPLVLLIVLGGYFGLRSLDLAKDTTAPVVAVLPNTAPSLPIPQVSTEVVSTAPSPEQIAAVKKPDTATVPNILQIKKTINAKGDRQLGGSFDETSGVGRKIYRSPQIPAKDVLNLLGAKGTFSEDGWTVDVPTANSLAERSGVQAGDVIEAINDQVVNEKTSIRSRSGIKSVRVRRDGKSINIVLKN